ncbi:methane monooxygenase PmoA-like [Herbihabitans rhizosphaerae]|uniref:Methane monooxygenase PmoA-like n=1 Tax=Herbihabitans rhizosphaerae TaxID=1872711 RepID=A0A4Q7KCC6_9PSEU|nr:PmoA family protein [Herbihabitans rhizosphaerae]RZS30306.1 methane monooxygenase PmoA-like [Herbihabitans rhizosphaerae]
MISLRHQGFELLRYSHAQELARPCAHEVRTLRGHVVTGFQPIDHPWHTGLSVAVPDVSGVNLWGGPTYVAGEGYVERNDHGLIRHDGWASPPTDGEIVEDLSWLGPDGATLATERRTMRVDQVDTATSTWTLAFSFRVLAKTRLEIGSPATHGRAGAGYGGLFLRASASFADGTASTKDGPARNGVRAPWLVLAGSEATICFLPDPQANEPWFVRTAEYPGVCAALAFRRPLVVPEGESLSRDYRLAFADTL